CHPPSTTRMRTSLWRARPRRSCTWAARFRESKLTAMPRRRAPLTSYGMICDAAHVDVVGGLIARDIHLGGRQCWMRRLKWYGASPQCSVATGGRHERAARDRSLLAILAD